MKKPTVLSVGLLFVLGAPAVAQSGCEQSCGEGKSTCQSQSSGQSCDAAKTEAACSQCCSQEKKASAQLTKLIENAGKGCEASKAKLVALQKEALE